MNRKNQAATNEKRGRALSLRHYGDPLLRKKTRPVPVATEEITQLALDMIATMHSAGGIGLAAPQIGRTLRLTVIDLRTAGEASQLTLSPDEQSLYNRMPLILLNPRIISAASPLESEEEGCLSLPDIQAPVPRPGTVVFQAELLDGSRLQSECRGLLARCLQHEIDHLNGITFNYRLSEENASAVSGKLKQLEKKTKKELKRIS